MSVIPFEVIFVQNVSSLCLNCESLRCIIYSKAHLSPDCLAPCQRAAGSNARVCCSVPAGSLLGRCGLPLTQAATLPARPLWRCRVWNWGLSSSSFFPALLLFRLSSPGWASGSGMLFRLSSPGLASGSGCVAAAMAARTGGTGRVFPIDQGTAFALVGHFLILS